MLVVGDHVVDLDPEAAAGQLHGPAEVAKHGVHALVVAGQLAAAGGVPDDIGGGEQLTQWTRNHLAPQTWRLDQIE